MVYGWLDGLDFGLEGMDFGLEFWETFWLDISVDFVTGAPKWTSGTCIKWFKINLWLSPVFWKTPVAPIPISCFSLHDIGSTGMFTGYNCRLPNLTIMLQTHWFTYFQWVKGFWIYINITFLAFLALMQFFLKFGSINCFRLELLVGRW